MLRPYRLRALPWSRRSISSVKRASPFALRRGLATATDMSKVRNGLSTRETVTDRVRAKEPTELDQLTRLPNGVRVATEALPGAFSGVGVYIDAGSRYESDDLRGVSHIIDRLAFKVRHCVLLPYRVC